MYMYLSEYCTSSEFSCQNNRCISQRQFCDKIDDCGDNSDEPQDCQRDSDQDCQDGFMCAAKCIPKHWECDGDLDCGKDDSFDEASCGMCLF